MLLRNSKQLIFLPVAQIEAIARQLEESAQDLRQLCVDQQGHPFRLEDVQSIDALLIATDAVQRALSVTPKLIAEVTPPTPRRLGRRRRSKRHGQ